MCSSLQQFVGSTSIKDKCQSGSSVYSHEQFGICKACYLKVLGVKESFKNICRFDAVGLTNYRGSGRGTSISIQGLQNIFKVLMLHGYTKL